MALLAYLAVTEKGHSRDSLATLFWPEADQRKARTTLRHHIWSLNKALGDGWLEISRETIDTGSNPDLWVDVNQFWHELAACQTHDHATAAVDGGGGPNMLARYTTRRNNTNTHSPILPLRFSDFVHLL